MGAHAAARERPASGGALRPRGWLRWRGARDPWGEGRRGKAGSKPQHEAWHVPPLPSVAPAASLAAGARWDSDPPPSLPYKVDTSRPSLRTIWTRLVHDDDSQSSSDRVAHVSEGLQSRGFITATARCHPCFSRPNHGGSPPFGRARHCAGPKPSCASAARWAVPESDEDTCGRRAS